MDINNIDIMELIDSENKIKNNKIKTEIKQKSINIDNLTHNDLHSILDYCITNILNNEQKELLNNYINKNDEEINKHENDKNYYIIFTDGATSGNGKTNATGGIGIYFYKSIINLDKIQINKNINNTITFKYDSKKLYNNNKNEIVNNNKTLIFPPTNIRAEGYAILYSLILYSFILIDKINDKHIIKDKINNFIFLSASKYYLNKNNFKIKNKNKYNIEIQTDSQFWIDVCTNSRWLPIWISKKTIEQKKNLDLLLYINYYINFLNTNNIFINFKFIKAHAEKLKKKSYNNYETGNMIADKLATNAKYLDNLLFNFDNNY